MAKTREEKQAYQAAWRARNRTRIDAYAANYREKNKELLREKRLKAYAENPAKFCAAQRKYRPQQREYQRARKNLPAPTRPCPDRCEACGKLPGKYSLALDHNHVTGKFRGWLCGTCNTGIGSLGDTAEGVLSALIYLDKYDG